MSVLTPFLEACQECFSALGPFYIFYALGIVLLALLALRPVDVLEQSVEAAPPALQIGDIGVLGPVEPSIHAKLVALLFGLFRGSALRSFVSGTLRIIQTVTGMRDERLRFRTYLGLINFYFLIIPLPAAFMPPVGYPQRPPDATLLAAVLILIFVNALGDAVSLKVTVRNFRRHLALTPSLTVGRLDRDGFWRSCRQEAQFYVWILFDTMLAALILGVVLMISSVLFGVQIGQCNFSVTSENLSCAWDRVWRFPELATEMYWFRSTDQPPFGWSGIPGIFLYGLTTFIPTLVIAALAVLWIIALPIRILLFLPATRPIKILSAELAVMAICIGLSHVLGIRWSQIYGFLNTT